MAARPQNDGYWMVAADGGIFAFGNARYLGSGAGKERVPCVAMSASTSGAGYALCFLDGSVLTFGDAPFLGSASGRFSGVAVGMAGKLQPVH